MPTPDTAPAAGLADRIQAARRRARLTQAQLAQAVGVTRSAVAQWETGRTGQVGGNLARIAAALNTSVEHLLLGETTALQTHPAEELALLRAYRACSENDRAILLRTAVKLARSANTEINTQESTELKVL